MKHTWARVDRFRFPVRISEVIQRSLLQGLDRFVLVYQRVTALAIPDETSDDAANGVRSISTKAPSNTGTQDLFVGSPQVPPDRVGDFE